MNLSSYSPALTLGFVFLLLWMLMDVRVRSLRLGQRIFALLAFAVLAIGNHILCHQIGSVAYRKLLILVLHLPTFLIFRYLTKYSLIKTAFMILTAVVFTSPSILAGNLVRTTLFVGNQNALLISNLIAYVLTLLLAWFVFRKSFQYLLRFADDRLFLLFSSIPLLYYAYVIAVANYEFSALTSFFVYFVRIFPTVEVLLLYFMVPYIYRRLSERKEIESVQTALQQKISAAEDRITLLNEAQTRTAIYRHDMRHQLVVLEGLLTSGNTERAQEFVREVRNDLENISAKRFCENETLNLLCSSFLHRANRMGIHFDVQAALPQKLSVSDTELCSLLSNGLENALHAAEGIANDPTVSLYVEVKFGKLLIEITNPYVGEIVFADGLPISDRNGHGYGCLSIRSIVEQYRGHCTFEAADGIFTLRVILPQNVEMPKSPFTAE